MSFQPEVRPMKQADVTVVIATFGDDYHKWDDLAQRAEKSVQRQTVHPKFVRSHMDTLQAARNIGAVQAGTEYLIFLDADDELDKHYVEAMLAAEGDIRRPATLGVVNGVEDDYPVMIPVANLLERNYIVIGAMVRRDMFMRLHGFDDYPVLEDWALWLKMVQAGASIVEVPDAIYRVHVQPDSRNQPTEMASYGKTYSQIRARFR